MTKALCASCALIGRKGYCAPLRCLCGHKTCHAYASWTPMPAPRIPDPEQPKPKRGLPLAYLAEHDSNTIEET